MAIGFLPSSLEGIFIGGGTVLLAFYPDGILPASFARVSRAWRGATMGGQAAPGTVEPRTAALARSA
jgi:hypothetical protein